MRMSLMGMQLGLWRLLASGSSLLDGLVSYWPLNEISGVRYDAVGVNHLTDNNTVGAALYFPLELNAAVMTRGTNNATAGFLTRANVTLPDSFTFSVWATRDLVSYTYAIPFSCIDDSDNLNTAQGRLIWFRDGLWIVASVGTGVASVSVTLTGVPFTVGTPYHFTLQYDSGTRKCRAGANGAFSAWSSALGSTRTTVACPMNVGGGWSPTSEPHAFGGQISQPILWDRSLSDAELAALYNAGSGVKVADFSGGLASGIVSRWTLSESSGTRDDAVGALDLTERSVSCAGVSVKNNNAASFVRANTEYLNRASQVLPANSDFTVTAWVKAPPATAIAGMLPWKTKSTTGDQHGIYFEPENGSNHRIYNRRGYGTAVEVGDNRGNWILMVYEYVHSTTATRVMALGSASNSGVWTAASVADLSAATNYFSIGGPDAGIYMEGQIDEVAIWSRVLTADERAELYSAGAGKFYSFS